MISQQETRLQNPEIKAWIFNNPTRSITEQLDIDIDISTSFLIADKAIDTISAEDVGVSPILVKTGYGLMEQGLVNDSVLVASDVFAAVNDIVCQSINKKNGKKNAV